MTTDPGELYVSRDRLHQQAQDWSRQSHAMGAISNQAESMLTTMDGGPLFHEVIAAYNAAAREFGELTGQGEDVMAKISMALFEAVDIYELSDEFFKKYFPGPTLF